MKCGAFIRFHSLSSKISRADLTVKKNGSSSFPVEPGGA